MDVHLWSIIITRPIDGLVASELSNNWSSVHGHLIWDQTNLSDAGAQPILFSSLGMSLVWFTYFCAVLFFLTLLEKNIFTNVRVLFSQANMTLGVK